MRRGLRRGYSCQQKQCLPRRGVVSRRLRLSVRAAMQSLAMPHGCEHDTAALALLILAEYEVHGDLRIHLDGFAVENVGAVTPLAHSLKCRWD